MKRLIMKCTRQRSHLFVRLICLTGAMVFFDLSAHAQNDVMLPAVGGGGGSRFVARCPEGKLLAGLELNAGDWVASVRPQCVADYGLYSVSLALAYPSTFGGDGGRPVSLACTNFHNGPIGGLKNGSRSGITIPFAPIVLGMYVGSEGKRTVTVNRIHLICGVADPENINSYDTEIYEDLVANKASPPRVKYDGVTQRAGPDGEQSCPQGLVAVGIHGSSGVWLDSVGLICGAPRLTPAPSLFGGGGSPLPPVALGREQGATKGPPMSICARSRDARARNSPAAPALEQQCQVYLKSHPLEDPRTVLTETRSPVRNRVGGLVFGKPDVIAPMGPAITAAANPVILSQGQVSGTTTISWKAPPDYNYCEIYVSVDNGEWSEFARGGNGSKPTTIKLGSSYTFRMMIYEGQQGTPKIVSTFIVTAQNK